MRGVRPIATRSSSASTRLAVGRARPGPRRSARPRSTLVSSRTSTPPSRSASATCSAGERLLALDQALAPVHERHLRAERRPRLRHLDADDAAAEHEEPRAAPPSRSSPRRSSTAARRARPGTSAGSSPSCRSRRRPPSRAPSTVAPTTTRRSPSSRPCPRTSETPRSVSHGTWRSRRGRGSPRRGGRARPGTSSGPVATPGTRRASARELDRPQQRLRGHARIEGALPPTRRSSTIATSRPRLAQPPGEHLARRARADHDHVELALLHSPPPVVVSRV